MSNDIKFYIVGGYVRDKLLGIESRDVDYCVVGATPEVMEERGFKQVGADFPVFLDESGEEYALARTERKSGTGYHGFEVDFNPDITIEDDLERRDLTINAMALDSSGNIVDPYGGKTDLENKVIRHVSDSFREDPLRVLRTARFAAKFPDFSVHEDTKDMMRELVENGEIDNLTPERVSAETIKALKEREPSNYFKVLQEVGALERIMPEVSALDGIEQRKEHHPEVDTFIHTMLTLEQATKLSSDPVIRFGALVHDLGKAVTGKEQEDGRHHNHEKLGVPIVEALCDRLKFPKEYKQIGMMASKHHLRIHRTFENNHKTWCKIFNEFRIDQEKGMDNLRKVITISEADAKGRTGMENKAYPQPDFIEHLATAHKSVKMPDVAKKLGKDINKETIPFLKEKFEETKKRSIYKAKKEYVSTLESPSP